MLSGAGRNGEKKGETQTQNSGERRAFGSFLADVASGRLSFEWPEPIPLTPEEDAQSTKRAWERVFLPKKVARLEAKLAAIKRMKSPDGKCPLWKYVRAVKEANLSKASDHEFIARCVDALLEKRGKELRDVCPKSWKGVRELPRLLSDARKHPKLKANIKVFISKVMVS